jgi:phage shock protein A
MFDDLRAAFREALDNFNAELNRDRVPETADRLLRGMKRELVDSKAMISELERQVQRAEQEVERERTDAATARRREELARRIGDEETAAVARKYAERHEERHRLLERKAATLREELTLRRRDTDEMLAKYQEASKKRDALASTAGRSAARESIHAADDLFSELDRMAEAVEGERAQAEAAEALDDLDLDGTSRSDFHVDLDEPREELDVDAALAELKRRMGRK